MNSWCMENLEICTIVFAFSLLFANLLHLIIIINADLNMCVYFLASS